LSDDLRRRQAIERLEAARKTDDLDELGRALTALSWVARDTGIDERPPFVAAAACGLEAVGLFRRTGNLAELSAALRAAACPFTNVNVPALLDEAIDVARASGDRAQEAWSLLARGSTFGGDLALVREAHDLFVALGLARGEAAALRTLGMRDDLPRFERAELLERSGDRYLMAGDAEEAHRSFWIAATFGSPEIVYQERIRLLGRALETTSSAKAQALTFRMMANAAETAGDAEAMAQYRSREDALDVAAYGSRANRLRSDLEALQEVFEVAL
jgi:hypothetical protein